MPRLRHEFAGWVMGADETSLWGGVVFDGLPYRFTQTGNRLLIDGLLDVSSEETLVGVDADGNLHSLTRPGTTFVFKGEALDWLQFMEEPMESCGVCEPFLSSEIRLFAAGDPGMVARFEHARAAERACRERNEPAVYAPDGRRLHRKVSDSVGVQGIDVVTAFL